MATVDEIELIIKSDIESVLKGLSSIENTAKSTAKNLQNYLSLAGDNGGKGVKDGVEKGLKDAERSSAPAASNIGTVIARSLGYAISTALTAILTRGIQEAISSSVKDANLSQDNRLSPQVIGGLQASGRNNNVSSDEIKSAIEAFTEVSKQTKDDAEDFYKALSNIGPQFAKAFETAPTQADRLKVLGQALASTTDEVKRAQLSQEAFGTDNERLTQSFQDAGANLDEYAAAARRLGYVQEAEITAKAKEADRVLGDLSKVLGTQLKTALVELAPLVVSLGNGIAALSKGIGDFFERQGYNELLSNDRLRDSIKKYRDDLESLGNEDTTKALGFTPEQITAARDLAQKRIDEARAELSRRGQPEDKLSVAIGGNNRSFRPRPELNPLDNSQTTDADLAEKRLNSYTDSLKRQTDVLKAQIDTFGLSNVEQQKAIELAKANTDLNKLDSETRDEVTKKLLSAVTASSQYREQLERLQQAQRQLNEQSSFFADQLSTAFDSLLFKGASFADTLKNIGQQLASQTIRGFLSGTGPFAQNPGIGGNPGGLIGSIAQSLSGSLPKFASGGNITAQQFALVGENGPEIVRFGAPGTVYPSGTVPSVGGAGMSVTINNNVGANVSTGQDGGNLVINIDSAIANHLSNPTSQSFRALSSVTGLRPTKALR